MDGEMIFQRVQNLVPSVKSFLYCPADQFGVVRKLIVEFEDGTEKPVEINLYALKDAARKYVAVIPQRELDDALLTRSGLLFAHEEKSVVDEIVRQIGS